MAASISSSTAALHKMESFVDDVLRRNLTKVLTERDKLYDSISQHIKLINFIKDQAGLTSTTDDEAAVAAEGKSRKHPSLKPFTTLVDTGCHTYATAKVKKSRTIVVNLGCGGLYADMYLPEAIDFLERKIQVMKDRAERLTSEATRIKFEIKLLLEALGSMMERHGVV